MSIQTDVLVIGSGVAGSVALARAQERGLSVMGVSKSIGASGYSSGAVVCFDVLPAAMTLFQHLTQSLGYASTALTVTQVGQVKKVQLVQASQVVDESVVKSENIFGVVEFSGLPSFRAQPVVNMLRSYGHQAEALRVSLKPAHKNQWDSFIEFAKDFENPDFLDDCMDAIEQVIQVQPARFAHVFLPAVFGLTSPLIFLRSLQMRVGAPCSELLGLSHSIPGLRLGHVLSQGFQKASIASFELSHQKITRVILDSGEIIEPRSIILATGRFLSGGFGTRESIFGLPLVGQERFKMGLAYDEQQRPLGEFGELFASNLFAAGSSLGGYDPAEEGGIARAIHTGYRAGDLC